MSQSSLLPVAFEVIGMSADRTSHSLMLREVRRGGPATAAPTKDSEMIQLTIPVTPDVFAMCRIGLNFELIPMDLGLGQGQGISHPFNPQQQIR